MKNASLTVNLLCLCVLVFSMSQMTQNQAGSSGLFGGIWDNNEQIEERFIMQTSTIESLPIAPKLLTGEYELFDDYGMLDNGTFFISKKMAVDKYSDLKVVIYCDDSYKYQVPNYFGQPRYMYQSDHGLLKVELVEGETHYFAKTPEIFSNPTIYFEGLYSMNDIFKKEDLVLNQCDGHLLNFSLSTKRSYANYFSSNMKDF